MMASAGVEPQSFKGIFLGAKTKGHGKFKMSPTGVGWKHSETGRTELIEKKEMASINWMRVARGYQLKFNLKNGTSVKFEGFDFEDKEAILGFAGKYFEVRTKEVEPAVKGWNWGEAEIEGGHLQMTVAGRTAFELPLTDVTQAVAGGKGNELSIELAGDGDDDSGGVQLVELRFQLNDRSVPAEAGEGEDEGGDDGEAAGESAAVDSAQRATEQLREAILAQASVTQVSGEGVVSFKDIACLVPRGRYDLDVHQEFVRMRGKTFDYNINMAHVKDLIVLPKTDGLHIFFVMCLDPPVRQGMTRYPFLVFQLVRDEELEVELKLDAAELADKYPKLKPVMNGSTYEVVSKVMKSFTGRKLLLPGQFKSKMEETCVKASYKANEGFLYPLDKGVVFLTKPTLHFSHKEIDCVEFSRLSQTGGVSTRSFDLDITTTRGNFNFHNIAKGEYKALFEHFQRCNIKIENADANPVEPSYKELSDGSDDEHDAYLARVKRDGEERGALSSSEDDEDFNAAAYSDSDAAEEYDSEASSGSGGAGSGGGGGSDAGSEDSAAARKRKEKKKARKEKELLREERRRKKAKQAAKGDAGGGGGKAAGTKRKKKKKKDPNAPKKPMTSYMLWQTQVGRKAALEAEPGMSVAEVGKKCGALWKEMGAEEKQGWADKAKVAKEEYTVAYAKYLEEHPDAGADDSDSGDEAPKAKKPRAKSSGGGGSSSSATKKVTNDPKIKSAEFVSSSDDSD